MYWYKANLKDALGHRGTITYKANNIKDAEDIANKASKKYTRETKVKIVGVSVKRIYRKKKDISKKGELAENIFDFFSKIAINIVN